LEGFGYSDLGFDTAITDALDDIDWTVEEQTCFWFWFLVLVSGCWRLVDCYTDFWLRLYTVDM
jgi:hypothetical protein